MHFFCHLSTCLTVYKKFFPDALLSIANAGWWQRNTEINGTILTDVFQRGKRIQEFG